MTAKRFSIGPAALVAAAFIGPGTVTTCTLAGANFGYALIWALVFSVIACMLLQEMSARLGVVTQQGLGEVLKSQFNNPVLKAVVFGLVAVAIFIGNGAYEGGNIAGAALGLDALLPSVDFPWPVLIVAMAFLILVQGSYQVLEKALIVLVLLMSLAFVTTFVMTKPDLAALFSGLKPQVPEGAWLTVIALVGTTVVPYNLFLHASAVKNKWQHADDLPQVRKDTMISIGVGGLISLAVISTAAAAFFGQQVAINSAADMSVQLQPLLGSWAAISMGVGLFAAGISSSITAPLAAAYAIAGMLGWSSDGKDMRFKLVWAVVLFSGLLLSLSGYKPITIIWFAQIANGILLPLLAGFLLYVMNQSNLLGKYRNTWIHNLLGAFVILVTLFLGGKSLYFAFT
ncbi:Nramp family divalent metal transporter [Marinicella litoralis]|uniref:NRAMP (Natural resistance-associated macrophage protein)-like metal ion transporter n=1 Tax=Marinicella litoralis TaxID=644220 RepID=A0A4R6XIY7_9GAMM|nr:Nramp family divalent metal transporter [Marinicella litoralis]TDR19442.1 NRAMP (natural resistance-associated macrophage protein)-like metal ion transporter [Marinicella litoralis]